MNIGFADANTFSMGAFYYGSKAQCPKHGVVGGDFHVYVTSEPEYKTGKICPKCFVDFIAANVQAVTPLPLGESEPRSPLAIQGDHE
jgi:hypothetical protein